MAAAPPTPGRTGEPRSAPEALRQVLAQRPFLMAFLVSLVRDFTLAEELFRDLCVQASTGRAELPRGGGVAEWARETARRRALATLRARSAHRTAVPAPELVDQIERAILELAESEGRWEGRKKALREALRELPVQLRQVLDLRYSQDLAPAHIGARLGLDPDAARAALQRARQELEACLRRRLGAPPAASLAEPGGAT